MPGEEPHAHEAKRGVEDVPELDPAGRAEREERPEHRGGTDALRVVPEGDAAALVRVPERQLVEIEERDAHRPDHLDEELTVAVLRLRVSEQELPPRQNAEDERDHAEHQRAEPGARGQPLSHGAGP